MTTALTATKAEPLILGGNIPILRLKWRTALPPGHDLPPYEDVVLGSLGRWADNVLLVGGGETPQAFKVLQAGRAIQKWVGRDIQGISISDFPADCALTLAEAIGQSLRAREPTFSVAHRVRDGLVETCEILALPMACRWGPPLVGIYLCEREARYDLVDTIFRATQDGMMALAAVRDAGGAPLDFQIVACNDAALRLLRKPEAELLWHRFSELQHALGLSGMFDHLLAALGADRSSEFQLAMARDGRNIHLKVGIAAIGDLLSATLTDISDVSEREASFRLLFDGNPVPM